METLGAFDSGETLCVEATLEGNKEVNQFKPKKYASYTQWTLTKQIWLRGTRKRKIANRKMLNALALCPHDVTLEWLVSFAIPKSKPLLDPCEA